MASGAEVVQVAGDDSQNTENLASHSEDDVKPTLPKQQLRHRQPYGADDEVNDAEKEVNKPNKSHGTSLYRKNSNASDDGNGSHGFLPGLMKNIGFGSQEFKEKDTHPSEQSTGNHGFMRFIKRGGSQEIKHGDGDLHHHHHHHPHGTRDKEIFGSEDADGNYREHEDLFGHKDMSNPHNIEKANSLFGNEDTEFERGEKGRDLFGDNDPDTLSFREKMNIIGPVETDEGEIKRTRHIFGDENAEDSDDEVGTDGDLKREKKVHHGHSAGA